MILEDVSDLNNIITEIQYRNIQSIWFTPVTKVPYDVSLKFSTSIKKVRHDLPILSSVETDKLIVHLYLLGLHNKFLIKKYKDNNNLDDEFLNTCKHLYFLYLKSVEEFKLNIKNAQIKKFMISKIPYTDIDEILKPQHKKITKSYKLLSILLNGINEQLFVSENEEGFFDSVYSKLKREKRKTKEEIISTDKIRTKEKEKLIINVVEKLIEQGDNSSDSFFQKNIYYKQAENLLRYNEFNNLKDESYQAIKETRSKINEIDDCVSYGLSENENLIDQLNLSWNKNDQKKAYKLLQYIYKSAKQKKQHEIIDKIKPALECFDQSKYNKETIEKLTEAQMFLNKVGNGPILEIINSEYGGNINNAGNMLVKFANELDSKKWNIFKESVISYNQFGLEGRSSVEYITHVNIKLKEVPFYSPIKKIGFTSSLSKFRQFVNANPHTLLYQLALGNQPYRQYFKEKRVETYTKILKKEAKYYLLDMSTSMKFDNYSRATFRDSIIISELNEHILESEKNGFFNPLYFQFFSERLHKVFKIESREEAKKWIKEFSEHHPSGGGTDITNALCSAFEIIRNAEQSDPDLNHATVVLVTDGDDQVNIDQIEIARKGIDEGMEVIMHFISIVEENKDLKQIVLNQNEEKKQAFYYHVTLDEIKEAEGAKLSSQILNEFPSYYFGDNLDQNNEKVLNSIKFLNSIKPEDDLLNDLDKEKVINTFDILFPEIDNEIKNIDEYQDEILQFIDLSEIGMKVNTVLDIMFDLGTYKFGSYKHAQENIDILNYMLENYSLSRELYLHYLYNTNDEKAKKTLKRIRTITGIIIENKQENKQEDW